ncbi:MAG: tetratricopeptide repeat protein [Myxococcota bacterium]|nr:tetratricopeptide repeat protein [Deltaproteobacteria bacterium]MDQ3340043.1 tetratricopeptide repeat protein [Myxococcota bacterium]
MISARARALIAAAVISAHAYADAPTPPDDAVMIKIRELYAKGDLPGVRRELLGAYETTQHPALLFAIGQVEFNLKNWQAAIEYYEKFIATDPPQEQVSLAQQGIGAARIEMQRERDRPPPPQPRRREWRRSDTITVAIGGGAVALGTAAFFYGRHLGNDHSGTLADYDARTDRARLFQWSGGALVAAGVITAGVTLVRWRLRPDDGSAEVSVTATGTAAQVRITW